MYLDSLRFQNFRLIHDATLKVSRNTTLIVGRNNSAKTSCMELMNKVLKTVADERGDEVIQKPSFDDYPLRLRPKLYRNVVRFLRGSMSFAALVQNFDEPSLSFKVCYGDEDYDAPLGELSHFIVDLNDDIDYVLIKAAYTLSVSEAEVLKAFDNYRRLYPKGSVRVFDREGNSATLSDCQADLYAPDPSTATDTGAMDTDAAFIDTDLPEPLPEAATFAEEELFNESTEPQLYAKELYEEKRSAADLLRGPSLQDTSSLPDYLYEDTERDEPLPPLNEVLWTRRDLQRVLSEHWEAWLSLKVWALSPETATAPDTSEGEEGNSASAKAEPFSYPETSLRKEVESYKLRALFPFYSIAAERALGEDDDRQSNTLAEIIDYYFNIQNESDAQYSKGLQELRQNIARVNQSLELQHNQRLEELLNTTTHLGRLTDRPLYLSVSTRLNLSEDLRRHSDLRYRENPPASPGTDPQTYTTHRADVPQRYPSWLASVADSYRDAYIDTEPESCPDADFPDPEENFKELLPNTHNGLGYKNLIKMEFCLTIFANSLKGRGPCLPLLFIEEPESHMHPQLQETFVTALHRFMKEQARGFDTHIFISSHSPHIANSLDFRDIRYARRLKGNIEYREVAAFMQAWQERKDKRANRSAVNLKVHKETDAAPEAENYKALQLFIHKYLNLSKCDLYFADKLILVEGESEKLLLPSIIKELCGTDSEPKYYSILVIGGAYAHKLIPLLDYLKIRTLILTDLDCFFDTASAQSVTENHVPSGTCEAVSASLSSDTLSASDSSFAEDQAHAPYRGHRKKSSRKRYVERPVNECNVCTNATLKYWFNEVLTPPRPCRIGKELYRALFTAEGKDHLSPEDKTAGCIHLEYQSEEASGQRGRSFEEALYCAQGLTEGDEDPLFRNAKEQSVSFSGNKIDFALNLIKAQVEDELRKARAEERLHTDALSPEKSSPATTSASPTDSMDPVNDSSAANAASILSGLNFKIPRYISEGLSWLFELPDTPVRSAEDTPSTKVSAVAERSSEVAYEP